MMQPHPRPPGAKALITLLLSSGITRKTLAICVLSIQLVLQVDLQRRRCDHEILVGFDSCLTTIRRFNGRINVEILDDH